MGKFWNREPVMFMAVVQAGIALLTAFGLHLTAEQVGAIMAFTAALLGLIVRAQVSPNDTALRVDPSKLAALLLVTILGASAAGCASKAPASLSPKGISAWEANQAVLTLGQVQKTAIGLNGIQKCTAAQPPACAPLLSDKNTGIVIDAVSAAVKSIEHVPSGWRATTTTALLDVRAKLDASGKSNLSAWLGVVDVFLQETH